MTDRPTDQPTKQPTDLSTIQWTDIRGNREVSLHLQKYFPKDREFLPVEKKNLAFFQEN